MAAGVIGMTFGTSGHLFEEVDKSELAASTAAIRLAAAKVQHGG
jgi:hypothetical protein